MPKANRIEPDQTGSDLTWTESGPERETGLIFIFSDCVPLLLWHIESSVGFSFWGLFFVLFLDLLVLLVAGFRELDFGDWTGPDRLLWKREKTGKKNNLTGGKYIMSLSLSVHTPWWIEFIKTAASRFDIISVFSNPAQRKWMPKSESFHSCCWD